MSAIGADSTGVYVNPPIEAPQVSMVGQVATSATSVLANIFTGCFRVFSTSPISKLGIW